MARYLSPEWFAEVAGGTDRPADAGPAAPIPPATVLEQVVDGGPDGPVTYRVEVAGRRARIVWPVPPDAPRADLRLTADWATAVSIAKGELSTQRALMQGRLRVSGNPGRLAEVAGELDGLDPVPTGVRQATTYGSAG